MTPPDKRRLVSSLGFGLFLLLLLAGPSLASAQIEIQGVRDVEGSLVAEFSLRGLISGRTRETLGRGMPATLTYRVELWKTRFGWFDKLVTSKLYQYRIRYDVWQDGFVVEEKGGRSTKLEDINQVERECCIGKRLPVISLRELEKGMKYFLVINASFKPLSLEEIAEMQGWLSGELKHRGEESGGGIPRYLLSLVVSLAGLGDKTVLARTGGFSLSDLKP